MTFEHKELFPAIPGAFPQHMPKLIIEVDTHAEYGYYKSDSGMSSYDSDVPSGVTPPASQALGDPT